MKIKDLLNDIYDKLADNNFDELGIEKFEILDFDNAYIDCGKNEIVLIKGDKEFVLTLTTRPYED